jgi:hypothetical protein
MRTIAVVLVLAFVAAVTPSCETPTVECWSDPAVGTACRCTQGVTPPSCTDLGSCLAECPL